MPTANANPSTAPSPAHQTYTTVSADIDFGGRCSRQIRVAGAGNLQLFNLNGTAADVIPDVAVGERFDIMAAGIKLAGTTCSKITVMF